MNQLIKAREKIRELDLITLFIESLKTQSSFTMEVEYDPPFAEDYNAWTIHISTPKTNDYPEGWFTHDCRYLVEDIKCDLDLKDGCEYVTNDQKCGLIVGRLKQAEYLRSSASKANKQ